MGVVVCPDTLGTAQASTMFSQVEPIHAEVLHHDGPTVRTGRLADCKRTHLPELRICAFHLNSHADCVTAGKEALTKILVTAVADQVSKFQAGSTFRSGYRIRPKYFRSDPSRY